MIRRFFPLLAILLLPATAAAQDEILRFMHQKAEIIVHVKILDPDHGMSINNILGWDTPIALCVVEESIKGDLKKGDEFQFSYYRSYKSEENDELSVVEWGEGLILFMSSTQTAKRTDVSGQVTEVLIGELIDRWLGAVYYQSPMVCELKSMTKK